MLPQDPNLLVGVINLKLRDNYSSLDALCDDMDEDKQDLIDRLAKAGFNYNEATNQFR